MNDVIEERKTYYEYIVIGCGGIGSATVYWLSKRVGPGVLGLEQFRLGHDNGGSQDHSRLIRRGSERESDIILLPDSYKTWREVEKEAGLQILYETGGLAMSSKDFKSEMVQSFAKCMERYGIKHERMDGTEIKRRFPQFTTDDNTLGVYEESAGFVDAAVANGVHSQRARSHGATIMENCTVTDISRDSSGRINIGTTKGQFQCRRLIVAAGAWTNNLLKKIGFNIPISVQQEQVTYFGTPNVKEYTKERFPVWFYYDREGLFYGFPIHGNTGTKVACHSVGPVVTAETRTFIPNKKIEEKCIAFMKRICPKALGPILYTKTCLYATTPDDGFIVDNCKHAGWPDISVCIGTGRIFKFCSLMGKILSEMAIDGSTKYDLSDFSINRDALRDPQHTTFSAARHTKQGSKL